ncbi:MAG TPA: TonB-dependent receptor, partial [Steroidobacteraceae bacterium]|nr:TonB-dependent receptor [Steroidobacteraceae bacterium]
RRSWVCAPSVMVLLCAWSLPAPGLRAAEAPAPRRYDFDLPAAPLDESLQRFNAQSGASAGMAGALPRVRTNAVAGRYTTAEALARMLAGSGIEAVAVGSQSFQLRPAVAARAANAPDSAPRELAEIVVTATKRPQPLQDLPLAVTAVTAGQIAGGAPLGGTRAALDFDAATSSTNLGPGRNRHFIRGVADSAFLGPSQATVSVQFDETRLNYSAPDPDLRLVDVDRVEILKGPQGPLYGTGALGGVVHILPHRPELDDTTMRLAAFAGDTAHGGVSSGGSAVLNVPLADGALGARVVGYAENQAGWIDNVGGRQDANTTRLAGGRMALRAATAGWLLDLQGVAQQEHVRDSQYVAGDVGSLARAGVLPEPRSNDLDMLSVVLHHDLDWGGLAFTSSYVSHEVDGIEDASDAAADFGLAPPLRYEDDRRYRLLANELRFSSAPGRALSWLAGFAQLGAGNHIAGSLDPAPAAGASVFDLSQHISDLALFGEADAALSSRWRLSAGLRLARVSEEDERRESEDPGLQPAVAHTATPSISLDWHPDDRSTLAYVRFAQAVRPGGLNPDGNIDPAAGADERRFHADQLTSLESGWRQSSADDAFALQAALFATRWRNVQSDYLQDNGLIGTRNVGNAGNFGAELQLRFNYLGWTSEAGSVLQRARLVHPSIPVSNEDARLPVVPDVRLYALQARDFSWGPWHVRAQLRADYVGSSRLSFDADLDRDTPASVVLAAAATLTHGAWELQFNAGNLLDSRADTFAFGNPFSIRNGPQRTPREPRTLTLQLAHSW